MTINYQFGDVDAHGAMIRAQAGLLEAEHQAIVRDVLAAGDFWGGAGSVGLPRGSLPSWAVTSR
ncbi:putative esat-6 like protein [Mycobacterium tuberculosis]|nr:putative esat-6 like protein [Mycobacterium tuberculosis]